MEKLFKALTLVALGALVGAVGAYLTTPTEPRVETCYGYHTLEFEDGVMVDTHLPMMDGCDY